MIILIKKKDPEINTNINNSQSNIISKKVVHTTGNIKRNINRKKKTVTLMEFFPAQFIATELKLPKYKRYKHPSYHKRREFQKDSIISTPNILPYTSNLSSCTTATYNIEQTYTNNIPNNNNNHFTHNTNTTSTLEFNDPDLLYQKFDITQLDSVLDNQQRTVTPTTTTTITTSLSIPFLPQQQHTTVLNNITNHHTITKHTTITTESLNFNVQKHEKQTKLTNSTITLYDNNEDSDDDENLCCICFDKPNFVSFSPCMHTSCADCANRLRYQTIFRHESGTRCPFCRSVVKAFYLLMSQN